MIKYIKFKAIKFLVFCLAFTIIVIDIDIEGCVGPFPTVNGPTNACAGEDVTFTATVSPPSPSPGYYSYFWTGPNGATSNTDTLVIQNAQPIINSGLYTVTVTDPDNCMGSDSINLTVNSNPTPSIAGPTQACIGTDVTFTVTGLPPGFYSYLWTGPDGATSTAPSLTVSNVQFNNAGTYTVTVTDLSTDCMGSDSINLTVNSPPTAFISSFNSNSVCEGNSTTLIANTNATSPAYQWFQDGNLILGATNRIFNISTNLIPEDYNYTVEITDINTGCSQISDPFTVTVNSCAAEEINRNIISPSVNASTRSTNSSTINSTILDISQKIVAGGFISTELGANFLLTRYRPDGSLDPTFNPNPVGLETPGVVITRIGPRPIASNMNSGTKIAKDIINSVTINPETNKIVAAGTSFNGVSDDFAIAVYQPDGALDQTFGSPTSEVSANFRSSLSFIRGGIVVLNISGNNSTATDVAVDSQLRYVVTGYTKSTLSNNINVVVVRLNSNGTLDTTFNPNGTGSGTPGILISHFDLLRLSEDANFVEDYSNALVIDSNDKIIIAGSSSNRSGIGTNILLARYNTDGSLDTTFNPGGLNSGVPGVVLTDVNSNFTNNNSNIGNNGNNNDRVPGLLSPINSNTTNSEAATSNNFLNNVANDVAIDSTGKILITGYTGNGTSSNVIVVRYNSNGTLDTTFNPNGIHNTIFDSTRSLNNDVDIINDFPRRSGFGGSSEDKTSSYFNFIDNIENIDNLYTDSNDLPKRAGFGLLGETNFNAVINPDADTDSNNVIISGLVITDVAGNADVATSIAVDSNDKPIVSGYSIGTLLPNSPVINELKNISDTSFLTIKYNSDGSLDETFNNTGLIPGIVLTTINNFGDLDNRDLATLFQSSNESLELFSRFPFADNDEQNEFVPRFVQNSLTGNFRSNSVLINPDNTIIAAGFANTSFGNNSALAKYTPTGTLDPSFNSNVSNSGVPGIVISILGIPPDLRNFFPVASGSNLVIPETTLVSSDIELKDELVTFKSPVITLPSSGILTKSNKIKLSGEGQPESLVNIFLDEKYITNVNTNSKGQWETILDSISEGTHTIYASSTNLVADQTLYSDTISVLVDSYTASSPVVLTPKNNFRINNFFLNITGTADPSAEVSVYINKKLVGTALATEQGFWEYKVYNIKDGNYIVSTVATDKDDLKSNFSKPVKFTVDTKFINNPTIIKPKDSSIATGESLTLHGKANPKSLVSLLVDDKIFDLQNNEKVITDKSGNWKVKLPELKLTLGKHEVQVVAESTFSDIDNKKLYSNIIDITIKPKAESDDQALQISPVSSVSQGGGTLSLYLDGKYLTNISTNINNNINNKSLQDYILANYKSLKPGTHKLNYVFHDDKDQPRVIGEKIVTI